MFDALDSSSVSLLIANEKPSIDVPIDEKLECNMERTLEYRKQGKRGVANDSDLTLILRRSRTGTVWFYTSTSNKRAARPKLYTKSLTRDLKRM